MCPFAHPPPETPLVVVVVAPCRAAPDGQKAFAGAVKLAAYESAITRQRPDRRLCGRDLRPAPAARHERHPDAHAHREPRARADRACPRGRPVLHAVREGAVHPGSPAVARLCGEGRRAAHAVPLLGQQRADQPYLADALPSPARAVLRRAQPDAAPRDTSGRRGPTRDRLGGPRGAQQRRRTRARGRLRPRSRRPAPRPSFRSCSRRSPPSRARWCEIRTFRPSRSPGRWPPGARSTTSPRRGPIRSRSTRRLAA